MDMMAVLQLYQWKTQMLYICRTYAWLSSEDAAAHLHAIYCNVAAMFVVSIYCVEGMDMQPTPWS